MRKFMRVLFRSFRTEGVPLCVFLLLLAVPCFADVMDDANAAVRAHEQGQVQEALELYTRAIDSGELPEGDNLLSYLHNNRALLLVRTKRYDEAMQDFNWALGHKKDYQIFFNRGRLYLHLGENQKALEDFTQCLMINPNYRRAFHVRGLAKLNLGDIKGGEADLEQAHVYFPYLKMRNQ